MRVFVSDPLDRAAIARLREAGHEVVECPGLARRELVEALRGAHALIVRGPTRVTEEVLRSTPTLRVVVRAGTGLDNVDLGAARELGVRVLNTPGATTLSVAEHAMALLLALERQLVRSDAALRQGRWRGAETEGRELSGRSLGLVGFGRIGREVAWRARAFGMDVLWSDPLIEIFPAGYEWTRRLAFEDLLREADVVSLHAPLTRGTRDLIGSRELALMKPDAVLVNTARGGLVDERALHAALASGRLRGAALDVFAQEPPGPSPLLGLPNVVVTPHLGASTVEAQRRAGLEAAALVIEALARPSGGA